MNDNGDWYSPLIFLLGSGILCFINLASQGQRGISPSWKNMTGKAACAASNYTTGKERAHISDPVLATTWCGSSHLTSGNQVHFNSQVYSWEILKQPRWILQISSGRNLFVSRSNITWVEESLFIKSQVTHRENCEGYNFMLAQGSFWINHAISHDLVTAEDADRSSHLGSRGLITSAEFVVMCWRVVGTKGKPVASCLWHVLSLGKIGRWRNLQRMEASFLVFSILWFGRL